MFKKTVFLTLSFFRYNLSNYFESNDQKQLINRFIFNRQSPLKDADKPSYGRSSVWFEALPQYSQRKMANLII